MGHGKHSASDVEPVLGLKVLLAHCRHGPVPWASLKCPIGHWLHVLLHTAVVHSVPACHTPPISPPTTPTPK